MALTLRSDLSFNWEQKNLKQLLCCSMEKLFHFLPRLNRKTQFLRSEILKNLNICPSKDRHLTCYTCYTSADFLHYGVMDLVKSFWSLFVWILAMGKIQKGPCSIRKGLEFSYNGKSGMIPNYISTPLAMTQLPGRQTAAKYKDFLFFFIFKKIQNSRSYYVSFQ